MLIQLLLSGSAYDLLIHYPSSEGGRQIHAIEQICTQSQPDVIILANDDFSTPLNQAFCTELRQSPYLTSIKLILLFKRGEYWRLLKPDCDADEYMRLPFALEELERRLQGLINKSS